LLSINPPTNSGHQVRRCSEAVGYNRLSGADDALFVCRVRVEDHGLLADLYFAVPEVASALVDVQDGTCRIQLRVGEPETAGDRAFSEQALAGAENYGKLPDT
jgi:hypothetical protein